MQMDRVILVSAAALSLVACGGGGSDATSFTWHPAGSTAASSGETAPVTPADSTPGTPDTPTSPQTPTTPGTPTTPAAPDKINITQLDLAQTHVVPEAGLSWKLSNAEESLHAIGGRAALALIKMSATDAVNPQIEGWLDGVKLGALPLSTQLPPTEAGGPAFATDRYSAKLPAEWLAKGVQLRVFADNYAAGEFRSPVVGPVVPLTIRMLPFYLFGADEANTRPMSEVAEPSAAVAQEVFAKWPASALEIKNHPAGKVTWPTLVIPPIPPVVDKEKPELSKPGRPAFVARNRTELTKDSKDGSAGMIDMITLQSIATRFIEANGEAPGPYKYYAPMMMLDSAGKSVGPGGGWAGVGGTAGAGGAGYDGIFIHEVGHNMGLPHANEAYTQGKYPYVNGSLAGSSWGYDAVREEFLAPFLPVTSSRYADCQTALVGGKNRYQIDAQGRCVKQDPMTNGEGDQARGYRFATFSDYSAAAMQRHLEGRTTIDKDGNRQYSGGNILEDAAFAGGYKRWDSIDQSWVAFDPKAQAIKNLGFFGLNANLPVERNVPVHAIALTFSLAGTPEVSQIYPLVSFTGNLLQYIDPTDAQQRATLQGPKGAYPWYCAYGGCDYTVRVRYVDGTVRHVLLKGGFRDGFSPIGDPAESATNPLHPNSLRTWVVHVPGGTEIATVELLDTPKAWEGMPAAPGVRVSRSFTPTPPTPSDLLIP